MDAPFSARRLLFLAILCVLALLGGPDRALAATKRVTRTALVIGNAKYEAAVGRLRNTGNDAKAVAQTLRGLGFIVQERHDLTREQLLRSVDAFRKTLSGAEIAVLYYAGHGISIGGANYLIPINSGFRAEGADGVTLRMLAETRLFNAEQAIAEMTAAGARCNLMILDACRNTPLSNTGRTRSLTAQAGLAEMTPPAGSLIAFSTEAGRTAFDGDGANGLYTEELLRNMRAPGLTIEQVFKRTRAGVLARSEGGQVPAEYSRLVGEDIYLAGANASLAAVPVATLAAPTPLPVDARPPEPPALLKQAAEGKTRECLRDLELLVRDRGPGEYAILVLEAVLERIKTDLKEAEAPSPRVIAAAESCQSMLRLLPECLPANHGQSAALAAKAHNRRGDALLLLGKPQEAIGEYDAALPLAPDDAYVLYNRGRAQLALGKTEDARADFTSAAGDRFKQPKAKKLALDALAALR